MTAPGSASALAYYGAALRAATTGQVEPLHAVDPAGLRPSIRITVDDWCGELLPGDQSILDRCLAATLDVGCGPGRLTEALHRRGVPAIGIDISAASLRLARHRGVPVSRTCVLTGQLELGQWSHVLLADGNIGIGGDPVRLLTRCRDLVSSGGDVIAELDRPGQPSWSGELALGWQDRLSSPFAWATVTVDDIADVARAAGLVVTEIWTEAGRWFARLARS